MIWLRIYCEMITTTSLVKILIYVQILFPCEEAFWDLHSEQLFKYTSMVNWSHHAVRYISQIIYFSTVSSHLLTTFTHFLPLSLHLWQPPICSLLLGVQGFFFNNKIVLHANSMLGTVCPWGQTYEWNVTLPWPLFIPDPFVLERFPCINQTNRRLLVTGS